MRKRFVSIFVIFSLLMCNVNAYFINEIKSQDDVIEKMLSDYVESNNISREDCLTIIIRVIGLTGDASTNINNVDFYDGIFGDVIDNGCVLAAGFNQLVEGEPSELGKPCFYPERPVTITECLAFMVSCLINSTATNDTDAVILSLAKDKGLIFRDDAFYENTNDLLTKETFTILLNRFLSTPVYFYFPEGPDSWSRLNTGYKDGGTYYDLLVDRANQDIIVSEWAEKSIESAIQNNLLPEKHQNNYTDIIDRVEVCQIVANYLNINDISSHGGMQNPFLDTSDQSVTLLYNLGIINGKTKDTFVPYDYITREEFAKIISNAYMIVNEDEIINPMELTYDDKDSISDWAIKSVKIMTTIGAFIGNDSNKFEPQSYITKEEFITVLLRLQETHEGKGTHETGDGDTDTVLSH